MLSYFPFAFSTASCVRSSTVAPFLFWLNAKPINPSTTKTAPATINQWGYSIAESSYFPFAFYSGTGSMYVRCKLTGCFIPSN